MLSFHITTTDLIRTIFLILCWSSFFPEMYSNQFTRSSSKLLKIATFYLQTKIACVHDATYPGILPPTKYHWPIFPFCLSWPCSFIIPSCYGLGYIFKVCNFCSLFLFCIFGFLTSIFTLSPNSLNLGEFRSKDFLTFDLCRFFSKWTIYCITEVSLF